ncbi:MAG: putative zinc-binding metallopeptidase [Deltaproteobacteria bacterium]|nr:putative zinc-binding metallopeptidase [Deltaproteobacteria bacterium]
MKVFHCDACQQPVFFENVRCLSCGHALAFLPDVEMVGALEPAGELWQAAQAPDRTYRLCTNYDQANVCNWAVQADDPHPLCIACRLTQTIPDLSQPGNTEAWYKLEVAKRRLLHDLIRLRVPVTNKIDDPEQGLAFEFLADTSDAKVLTGHDNGRITINLAEADDAEREKRRVSMHEPYRTLLGHCRHESGHYYWDRLLRDSDRLEAFRALFGDEREDYGAALQRHYEQGAPPDWQQRYISAYASSHAWEDWAETWAHYLHMTDALETAASCGLTLRPHHANDPAIRVPQHPERSSFERMLSNWFSLTYVLNNLNRGLGLADGYPFILSAEVGEKLRFVDQTIAACRDTPLAGPD